MKKFLPLSERSPSGLSLRVEDESKGFTLVELLVVITIIAILSMIGMVVFTSTQKSARDARRRSDIDAISKAWESHYSTTSPRYPALLSGWFSSGTPPRDPQSGATYSYTGANENSGADTYNVCATLENGGGNATSGTQYCISSQQ